MCKTKCCGTSPRWIVVPFIVLFSVFMIVSRKRNHHSDSSLKQSIRAVAQRIKNQQPPILPDPGVDVPELDPSPSTDEPFDIPVLSEPPAPTPVPPSEPASQPPAAPAAPKVDATKPTDSVSEHPATPAIVESVVPPVETGNDSGVSNSKVADSDVSKVRSVRQDPTPSNSTSKPSVGDDTNPVLGKDTPEWITRGLVTNDGHTFPISSSFFQTTELCRKDLESRMVAEVASILDKHVLTYVGAANLDELNLGYIRSRLLTSNEFDNAQERSSGIYHQLWVEVNIPDSEIKKIREWERNVVAAQRVKQVGALGGIGIVVIGLISGGVGFLARREQAKLKKS